MATSKSNILWRFGLRSLFVVMTLFGLLLATLTPPFVEARKQRRLITELGKLGASISTHGSVMREPSVGRAILGNLGNEYDRDFLYRIDFSSSSITDQDLSQLQQLPYLFHLDLSNSEVTDNGLDSIAACSNLYELNLSNTQVTDAGILKLKSLQTLAWLKATGTNVTYSALTELDDRLPLANFAEQRAIDEVQAYGGQAHGCRRYLENTENLCLRGAKELSGGDLILGMNRKLKLCHAEISHLAHLESLKNLNIHGVIIEPGSFSDVPSIPNLTNLEIWHTDTTDADLQDLARQTQVESFVIYNSKLVTDTGVSELAKLRNLKTMSVKACPNVSTRSIEYLQLELPDCKITYSK